MALELNVTWGDSWRRPRAGLGAVVDRVQQAASATRVGAAEGDYALDIYIYVSGKVWQHQDEGIRLGTLSSRGRNSLRVMIFVPDELTEDHESVIYFREALEDAAQLVYGRLVTKSDWPARELAEELRSLIP